jgi:hypothetical protein
MNKRLKFFLYALGVTFVLIQLYPVDQPMVTMDNPNDLLRNAGVPKNIASILKSACYDCHSNETKYPLYSYIAPVKWLVYEHINHGREELNFSEWDTLSKTDLAELLDDMATNVMEKEMPLKFYPIMHPNAKLSDVDRQAISDWAENLSEELFE